MTIQQMLLGSGTTEVFTGLVAQLSQTSVSLFTGGVAKDGTSIYAAGYDATNFNFNLTKISSTGSLTWQRKLSLSGASDVSAASKGYPQNCVADSSGNVYFVGWFQNSSSIRETVLVKYNSSGTIQWQRKILGPSSISAQGEVIAIDSTGSNVFISLLYTRNSSTATAIIKYNSSGTLQWQRTLYTGGFNNVQANCLTVDSSGNLFVGGQESVSGSYRGFIAKYDSTGAIQWQQYMSTAGQGNVRYIWLDGSGNLICGGSPKLFKLNSTASSITFNYDYSNGNYGTYGMIYDATSGSAWGNYNNGTNSAFISQYDSSGNNSYTNQLQLFASLSGPGQGAGAFGATGYYLMVATAFSNSTYTGQIGVWRLPTNMSATTTNLISLTTWSQYQYIAATAASTSAGGLSVGADSMTETTGTMVDAAGSYTDAAVTLTLSSGTWTN